MPEFKRGILLQLEVLATEESRDVLPAYDAPDGEGPVRDLVPVDNGLLRLCVRFPGGKPFPILLVGDTASDEFSRASLRALHEQGLLPVEADG